MNRCSNHPLPICFITILFALCSAAAEPYDPESYEAGFQKRGGQINNMLLNNWSLPTPNFSNSDMHYWALALALLDTDPDAATHPWLNDGDGVHDRMPLRWGILKYDGESGDPMTTPRGTTTMHSFVRNPGFHFVFPGMARLMALHPDLSVWGETSHVNPDMTYREQYLHNVISRTDNYNIWTGEGTENHVAMSRPNGWIFAREARRLKIGPVEEWQKREDQMRNWLLDWAKRIYEVGIGEWDSSIYYAVSLQGWLNVYDYAAPDFANDPQVRASARAVLDHYAAAIALKNTQGQMGGAEMRSARKFIGQGNGTAFLSWLWFGADGSALADHVHTSSAGEVVYAISSQYRPPAEIVELARGQGRIPATYLNTKPDYLLMRKAETQEVFYRDHHFTLGSANPMIGRFTNGNWQIAAWKLLAHHSSGNPELVWGNGGYSGIIGNSPDPWMQLVQNESVLLQLHWVPDDAEEIVAEVRQAYEGWRIDWLADFLKRFPTPDYGGYQGDIIDGHRIPHGWLDGKIDRAQLSFILYPESAEIIKEGPTVYIQLEQVIVAVHSITSAPLMVDSKARTISVRGPRGALFGLALEVESLNEDLDPETFRAKIRDRVSVDRSRLGEGFVRYQNAAGVWLEARYARSGSWKEPSYDMAYGVAEPGGVAAFFQHPWRQPDWPTGRGNGRRPIWSVEGNMLDENAWAVFNGPDLELRDGVMRVLGGSSVYEVDFTGVEPVFHRQTLKSSGATEVAPKLRRWLQMRRIGGSEK